MVTIKKKLLLLVSFVSASIICCANDKTGIDEKAADLVSSMTLEEKIDLLHGTQTPAALFLKGPGRLDVPDFHIYHGPFGMKCPYMDGNQRKITVGTYFPTSSAMAATFDDQAVEELGIALGAEIRAYGGLSNAGPAMNIIRDPRTGRSFEYFTEDPYLNARIATANVKGQQHHTAAIIKHFACNNQELDRYQVNVHVGERALHEIYLPGFEGAVKDGDAKIVMSSYNMLNGEHCSESKYLLTDILRNQWGFNGFVLSDWGGTHTTVKMAESGMDVEMPKAKWYGDKMIEAVRNGRLSESRIDSMAYNVMRVLLWTQELETPGKDVVRSQKHLDVARKVASEAMVLLKNEEAVLPFDQPDIRKIAVIGPNGNYGPHFNGGKYHHGLLQGGGSANVMTRQENMVTPYQGLKANAPAGVEVRYAPGCYAESGYGPIPARYLSNGKGGTMTLNYYKTTDFTGKVIKSEESDKVSFMWNKGLDIPEENGTKEVASYSVSLRTKLKAPETGSYGFEIRNESGSAQLFIDGRLVAENMKGNRTYWHGTGSKNLKKGREYDVEIKYVKVGDRADVSLNWDYENKQYLKEAIQLAAASDAVILTVGLGARMGETEAGDRLTMDLAPAQETLINEICRINKRTAVAIIAGSSVTMNDWIDSAPAVLFAWYPGEQGGNALADIVFGKVNPAGRLPMTFPASDDVYPEDFYSKTRKIDYKEDIFVGYRYFDHYDKPVRFPFGYGLSYTQFSYSDMTAKVNRKGGDLSVAVSLKVKNTGERSGDEVVQIYVSDPECSVARPEKELKEFRRIHLEPGEQKEILFTLPARSFSYWDEESSDWNLEPGTFIIHAGASSADFKASASVGI